MILTTLKTLQGADWIEAPLTKDSAIIYGVPASPIAGTGPEFRIFAMHIVSIALKNGYCKEGI